MLLGKNIEEYFGNKKAGKIFIKTKTILKNDKLDFIKI